MKTGNEQRIKNRRIDIEHKEKENKTQEKYFEIFFIFYCCIPNSASQVALVVKNQLVNAGGIRDVGSIPGLGRSPKEGNGNPLQYSCLGNPMDREAWQVTVHGITVRND